jgi:NAD(P)-dependent dehydrogenase (short-subunit alcohol dehydrogenase family)
MKNSIMRSLAAALGAVVGGRALLRRLIAYDVRDKVAIVTGGSRGLGLVISRELVQRGAKLAICARERAELDRAVADLQARGGDVLAIVCDVRNREDVTSFVARVRARFGAIDILINNAGVIQVGPMELMRVEDYEEAIATHFWGPLYLVEAVLPEMRGRRTGRIANIASLGGKVAVPHLLPYTASKFALVGYSEGLRIELAKDGIAVTTVVPGLMRTGSARNAFFKGKHRAEYAWFAIGDSSWLTSMRAERAAHRIIEAVRRGDAEVILSVQAQLAARLYGLAPGLAQCALAMVDRLLPRADGIGASRAPGSASESRWAPSFWTHASDRAAARNNEQ